ncbi:response regulator transcription factor [Pseudonocardia abyssalis]|uniref:Response regulator transcription factor n=1 Tax=Pseudonocardia abyssalis TaxID=2792008 RepID=A0ABS6ULP4_9PSEU|nr:response regulator transcription factor [Pseudonocardia abyssalis]MBW0115081.1 response regulator transcription factor [Pseudonocardia abyssalis]MBW0133176.1 response regulator transcription factor [Pseudonocardia abyssalis]
MQVLLVEDETALAETIREGLAEEGHSVRVAHDGPSGLAAALGADHDVIILDIMLPGLSGYRVLQALRARRVWTPVLMLTAKDGEYDEADAFDLGADDYLTKPFSFVVLLARLRALLRRGAAPRPAVLVVGELTLDPSEHRVERAGERVVLTPREFGVLEFLMRNVGRAVTKTEVLRAVWDPHYEGDVNVVEVYVGYLRRKLDIPFGADSIETLRGVGYRMRTGDDVTSGGKSPS